MGRRNQPQTILVPESAVDRFLKDDPAGAISVWLGSLHKVIHQRKLTELPASTLSTKLSGTNPWVKNELEDLLQSLAGHALRSDVASAPYSLEAILAWCGEVRAGKTRFPKRAMGRRQRRSPVADGIRAAPRLKLLEQPGIEQLELETQVIGEALKLIVSTLKGKVDGPQIREVVKAIVKEWSKALFDGAEQPPAPSDIDPTVDLRQLPEGTKLFCNLCDLTVDVNQKRCCNECGLFCSLWSDGRFQDTPT